MLCLIRLSRVWITFLTVLLFAYFGGIPLEAAARTLSELRLCRDCDCGQKGFHKNKSRDLIFHCCRRSSGSQKMAVNNILCIFAMLQPECSL